MDSPPPNATEDPDSDRSQEVSAPASAPSSSESPPSNDHDPPQPQLQPQPSPLETVPCDDDDNVPIPVPQMDADMNDEEMAMKADDLKMLELVEDDKEEPMMPQAEYPSSHESKKEKTISHPSQRLRANASVASLTSPISGWIQLGTHEIDDAPVPPQHLEKRDNEMRGGLQLGSSGVDDAPPAPHETLENIQLGPLGTDDDAPPAPHPTLGGSVIDDAIKKKGTEKKLAMPYHVDRGEAVSEVNEDTVIDDQAISTLDPNSVRGSINQRQPPSIREPTIPSTHSPYLSNNPSVAAEISAREEREGDGEESLPVLEATPVTNGDEIIENIRVSYQQVPDGPVYDGVVVDNNNGPSHDNDPWWKRRKGKRLLFVLALLMIGAAVVTAGVVSSNGGGEDGGPTDAARATLQPMMSPTSASPPPFQQIPKPKPDDVFIGKTTPMPSGANEILSPLPSHMPSSMSSSPPMIWEQLGNDIDGVAAYDQSGRSVSLSSGGDIVAVGSPFNDQNGPDAGNVRVFRWEDSAAASPEWVQIGQTIGGGKMSEWFGWSVDLSESGKVVAASGISNLIDNDGIGIVRVYELEEGTMHWEQLGNGIVGEDVFDASGAAVALSGDGRTVAIGSPLNNANGASSGHVRVFEFDGSDWSQVGSTINGDNDMDGLGSSLALSMDGLTLAVASPLNDDNGEDSGYVKAYRWFDEATDWKQIGRSIRGSVLDQAGYFVDMNVNGSVLAVGAIGAAASYGSVRIYRWDGDASSWEKVGQSIDGEASGDQAGSVSLSADGKTVAIGANFHDGSNGEDSGCVRIFRFKDDTLTWIQVGQNIDGEARGDWSGRSVDLSASGDIVAIGAKYNDGKATDSGHARIFRISPL